MNIRKHLSATGLFNLVRATILMVDILMSAFAMFSLKDDSLLMFDKRRKNPRELANLKSIYGIENVPCDTVMRDILDPVSPCEFRPSLKMSLINFNVGKY
jgi:hypothetical protein